MRPDEMTICNMITFVSLIDPQYVRDRIAMIDLESDTCIWQVFMLILCILFQ